MQAAGFVLVGGLSTRMGRDKALLSSGLHPLVADIAAQVNDAAGSVALIGSPDRYGSLGLDCLVDLRPGLGPMGGIEAALESRRGDLNLILACDMPGLEVSLLQALLESARQSEALCVVARDVAGRSHPLCAVYRSACLPVIQRALNARRLRLLDLAEELRAEVFETNRVIRNINTPQEWSAWREQQFSLKGAPLPLSNAN